MIPLLNMIICYLCFRNRSRGNAGLAADSFQSTSVSDDRDNDENEDEREMTNDSDPLFSPRSPPNPVENILNVIIDDEDDVGWRAGQFLELCDMILQAIFSKSPLRLVRFRRLRLEKRRERFVACLAI
jgi:hypothetical protein